MNKYLKVDNSDHVLSWAFKGLPNESITHPSAPNSFLNPSWNCLGTKIRVKFNGSCLKQDKITYTHGKVVNIYTVYETGIKIVIGHQKLSNKNVICLALMYQSRTFCPALLSLSIMCEKSFSISYSIL